jgi:hypothetical protein
MTATAFVAALSFLAGGFVGLTYGLVYGVSIKSHVSAEARATKTHLFVEMSSLKAALRGDLASIASKLPKL